MADKITKLERRAAFFFDQAIDCASLGTFQEDIKKLLVEEFRTIIRSEMNEILRLRKAIDDHCWILVSESSMVSNKVLESATVLKKLSEERPEDTGHRHWEESRLKLKPSSPWSEDQPDGNTGVTYGEGNG